MTVEDAPVHPLFPPLEDTETDQDAVAPIVSMIIVQRKENGRFVTAPRTFRAEELTSLEALYGEYGGGEYQLIARHNDRMSARRAYIISGKPKPMYDEGLDSPPKPVLPVSPMSALMPGGDTGVMGLIMMMMQQMMQSQTQAADRQMQLMLAMMNNSTQTNSADKIAQQAAIDRQREQDRMHSESMMAMMRDLASAKSGNGSSDETFFRGVEFMRTFSTQQVQQAIEAAKSNNDEGLEGLLGSVMQAIEGGMQLYKMSKEAGGVVPQVTQVPASEVVQ